MIDRIKFRPATIEDAPGCVSLIYQTMGDFADFLFGLGSYARAIQVIDQLYKAENNRFSYQFTDLVEIDGKVAGLLLSYPGRYLELSKITLARQLLSIYGVVDLMRFVRNELLMSPAKEAAADEYFINNVAVVEKLRGQGIGRYLLELAERKALAAGLTKCSLTVDLGNEEAISLYERIGYKKMATIHEKLLPSKIHYRGYYRMVKNLYPVVNP
jgi:ribosomal protein S18 acetylase RimI-like enzyme